MDMTHDILQQLNKFVQKLDCRSVTLRLLNNFDRVPTSINSIYTFGAFQQRCLPEGEYTPSNGRKMSEQ